MLMAFIFESMRYSPIVAYRSIIHTVTEPITVNGYSFNRDDMLWTAISSIQFDEKNFPEPYKFNPLRHIDQVTGEFHQPAKVLPYHFGRRACPGIVLANLELFYITINMLKYVKKIMRGCLSRYTEGLKGIY